MDEISPEQANPVPNRPWEPRLPNGMCQQDSAVQAAVQVRSFERGNTCHSDGIEFCPFASTSLTHGHLASEDIVPCDMMPRTDAELMGRANYNRPRRIFDARIRQGKRGRSMCR